jgi:hypothetical protein
MRSRIVLLLGALALAVNAWGDSGKGADYWNPQAKKVKKASRAARPKPKKLGAKSEVPVTQPPAKPLVEWPLVIWETDELPEQPAVPVAPAAAETARVTRAMVELALAHWLDRVFARQPGGGAGSTLDALLRSGVVHAGWQRTRYSFAGTHAPQQTRQGGFKRSAQAHPAAITLFEF